MGKTIWKVFRTRFCARVVSRSAMARMLALCAALACAPRHTGADVSSPQTSGEPLEFSFLAPDGDNIESAEMRGRVTLLLLIATFDMASQLSARQANELLHTEKPRINVGAVVMEAPQYAQLKTTFQQTFELDYPVVMADHATLGGRGPFGEIVHIPTLIVLDKRGRERTRLLGPVSEAQLRDAVAAARR